MMTLNTLTREEGIVWRQAIDPPITSIASDSRKVMPGSLFVALPGHSQHGDQYIHDACAKGAVAILSDRDPSLSCGETPFARIQSDDARALYARLCARFYGRRPRFLYAVTGTNGKTSVAWIAGQMLGSLYGPETVISIGTLGVRGAMTQTGSMTTPDPADFYSVLAQAASQGVDHCVCEASSHGLDQDRLAGAPIDAAAFTHLTRDHLDYHGSMEAYWAAKKRLFTERLAAGGVMVVNDAAPQSGELKDIAMRRNLTIVTYGGPDSDIVIEPCATNQSKQQPSYACVRVRAFGHETGRLNSPFLGDFQCANAAAALGLVAGLAQVRGRDVRASCDIILRDLATYAPVPGRMQPIPHHPMRASVFVDYAHTPDALDKALATLRPLTAGRVIVVFGCGGNRDAGKRSAMGLIAATHADEVIVTDDNPRDEDPEVIRAMIRTGAPDATDIADRQSAIHHALSRAGEGDSVLIAGKGHETGQNYGGIIRPFDDVLIAQECIADLCNTARSTSTERGIR